MLLSRSGIRGFSLAAAGLHFLDCELAGARCPGESAIVHLPDLAWIYRRLVARSALLSLGRLEDHLTCVLCTGDAFTFDTWSPRRTEQVVETLLERRPEVLTGHLGEWIELARQPEALWAELRRRRERMVGMSAEEREEWDADSWEICHDRVLRQDRQAGAN